MSHTKARENAWFKHAEINVPVNTYDADYKTYRRHFEAGFDVAMEIMSIIEAVTDTTFSDDPEKEALTEAFIARLKELTRVSDVVPDGHIVALDPSKFRRQE